MNESPIELFEQSIKACLTTCVNGKNEKEFDIKVSNGRLRIVCDLNDVDTITTAAKSCYLIQQFYLPYTVSSVIID